MKNIFSKIKLHLLCLYHVYGFSLSVGNATRIIVLLRIFMCGILNGFDPSLGQDARNHDTLAVPMLLDPPPYYNTTTPKVPYFSETCFTFLIKKLCLVMIAFCTLTEEQSEIRECFPRNQKLPSAYTSTFLSIESTITFPKDSSTRKQKFKI